MHLRTGQIEHEDRTLGPNWLLWLINTTGVRVKTTECGQPRQRRWWSNLQESYDLEISSIVFFEFHLVWAETGTHVFMNCLHIAILVLSWKYLTQVPANWAYMRAINPSRSCAHADLIVATITWLFFLASCSNTYFGVDNDRLYRI